MTVLPRGQAMGLWRSLALVLAFAAQLGAGARAQPAVPAEIAKVRAEIRDTCGGRATFKPGFQRTADFNGDGRPDYLLDYSQSACVGGIATNPFCGSAGCTLDILMSSEAGYRQAFGDNVRGWSLAEAGGRSVLVLSMHGSACGRSGHLECQRRLAWNGDKFVVAGRR
jgi:hypothetical protein